MGETIRADWFDIVDADRDAHITWLHGEFLPTLQSKPGVAWVGHFEIIKHPNRPYIEGGPEKQETSDPAVPTGWRNVVLTAGLSPNTFLGPGSADATLRETARDRLGAWGNHRWAVFIEELVVNGPEERAMPYGMGPPPAMQLGSYNTRAAADDEELALWYRAERFPRVSVSRGIIRGRKLVSVVGWAKHGVLWEGTELGPDDSSFEPRFIAADRNENWSGRHVLGYVVHAPGSPHAGRRLWPKV